MNDVYFQKKITSVDGTFWCSSPDS